MFPLKPEAASEHANSYDALFFTISALTAIFTIGTAAMIIFFALRYKAGNKVDRRNAISHSAILEALMLGIPLVLGLAIYFWSAKNFVHARTMPKDAMEIFVIGKRWMWHVQHMNGIRENNELHVPVGQPVKLTMISQDVVHAFYIPEFRAQFHVVPGRYTQLHFTPTKPGTYRLLCAMHCGTQHSEMVGFVHVMEQKEFSEWMETGGNRYAKKPATMAELGKQVWDDKNCGNCHTDKNTERGPSLLGIWNSTRQLENGGTAVANREYLRDSIVRPWDKISKGYQTTMQSYQSVLSEEQVLGLISYMQTFGAGGTPTGQSNYQQPSKDGTGFSSSGLEQIDHANERASAGAAQSEELQSKP